CERRAGRHALDRPEHVPVGCCRPARAFLAEDARRSHAAVAVLSARMQDALNNFAAQWMALPGYVHSTAWILLVTIVLIISVALLTLWERKVIGWMQLRKGPNRVGIFGLFPGLGQPFADVVKLLLKEVILPANANKFLFRVAPAITLIPAFVTWAVIPLSPELVVA